MSASPRESALDADATAHSNCRAQRGRRLRGGADPHLTEARQKARYKTVLTAPPLSYYICDLVLFFWLYHQNLTPRIRSTGFQS